MTKPFFERSKVGWILEAAERVPCAARVELYWCVRREYTVPGHDQALNHIRFLRAAVALSTKRKNHISPRRWSVHFSVWEDSRTIEGCWHCLAKRAPSS